MTDRMIIPLFRAQSRQNASGQSDKREAEKSAQATKARKQRPSQARFAEPDAKPGEAVFVLPLPPVNLSPNARCHWRPKAAAVKAYRQQSAALMRAAQVPQFDGLVAVDLEFYLCRIAGDKTSYYPKDEDNARASMKAAQDALMDAGIIAGDGKKHVRVGETLLRTRAKEHKGFTCVVMRVRKP